MMIKLTTISVLFVCFRYTSDSNAQPLNDECADAVIIPPAPTFPYNNTVLDFQNATEGSNDPLPSCLYYTPENGTASSFPTSAPLIVTKTSVWYSWTPSISGSFDFLALGGSDFYGSFYPSIALFQGSTCDDALEEIQCSFGFATSVNVSAGTQYFVFIEYDVYDYSEVESFVSNVTLLVQSTPLPPPNDDCVNAAIIPAAPTFPYSTDAVELAQATENPVDPFLTCNFNGGGDGNSTFTNSSLTPSTIAPSFIQSDGKTVWYSWTPTESGSYDFSTSDSRDVFGNGLYTTIGIFEGDSCEASEEIACLAGGERLRGAELLGGTTYRIKVGAFTDYGMLILTVKPTPPPPPNDECVDATVIPPAPAFPYSIDPVELYQATENPNDPLLTCNFFGGGGFGNSSSTNSTFTPSSIAPSFIQSDGKTVWYIWTPAASGSFDFVTTGSLDAYGSELYTTIGIFEGDSCEQAEEIQCKASGRLRGVLLEGDVTYRIKVGASTDDGTLILTVKPTPPPPPNDSCVGAIPIDPQSGAVVIMGDVTDAVLDSALENTCFTLDEQSGVWYKIDNTNGDVLGIIASTCDEGTTFDTRISIFKGDDCSGALTCVGSVDDSPDVGCGLSSKISFVANETTSYWILVHGFGSSYGNFTLNVKSVSSFLTLIDADSDSSIDVLGDYVSYGSIPASSLNIQAIFSNDLSVESVRLTFDNPRRSFCQGTAPYSVFGASNGNFFGKPIPVGTHLVTATAFAESNCQGNAGTTLSQSFEVFGCFIDFSFLDASNLPIYYYLEVGLDNELPSLPCNLNIEASVYCGFDVGGVRLELRDTLTNAVVSARTDMVPPFYVFGSDSNGNIATGSIAPGSYSITAWVEGIQHPPLNFTVVDACF
jgi:hypothetical protein